MSRGVRVARGSTAFALAAALAFTLPARETSAFCRTTTVPVVSDFQPSPTKCWEEGVPLFWRNACVGYNLQRGASRQVAYDDASNGVARGFMQWTGSSCPTEGTGRSRVSIDVRDLGPIECGEVDYNQSGGNQNVIVFRDGKWPHGATSNTLALTTVTFNPTTGEIYDADMEINTADQKVTLTDVVPPDGYDFASILTHEAGHFLGLAHSGDSRAAMFANYTPGGTGMRHLTADDVAGVCTVYRPDGSRAVLDGQATPGGTGMRHLTADDVAGVCAVYRPDGTRAVLDGQATPGPQCDPTPRRGFTGACATPPEKSCTGNAQIAATRPFTSAWWGLGVFVAAVLGVRRARRRA